MFSLSSSRRPRVVLLWLGLLTMVGRSWGADPGISPTEILVGNTITLEGGRNDYGVAAHGGMKLFFDQINAAGGVHGRKLELRTLDDDNKPATAEANARQLVRDGVFLLFGCIEGGPSSAVMKAAAELKVPLFGPMAGPPTLRRPLQPMVFPVRAEHREEFRALMHWGRSTGLRTVGFLHADSEGGRQHLQNVRLIAQELGLEVVQGLPLKSGAKPEDFDAMVELLKASRPDMMFNHGSSGAYLTLITKARAAGVKTTFMGVNSGSSQLAKNLGPLAQGMVFSQVVPSPWERKREIAREYQDALRKAQPDAEFSYGALEGYMTAKALALALKSAGRDLSRAGLVKALESSSFDLGGVKTRYSPTEHDGSHFVDLAIVSREGKFIH